MLPHKLVHSPRFWGTVSVIALGAILLNYLTGLIKPVTAKDLPAPAQDSVIATAKGEQTAVFAGGCFWGMEAVFEHLKGVSDVVSGFSGGSAATAQYERVSTGQTDHAEGIKITYDPSQVSYGKLLQVYFAVAHDPTQLNRQGPDRGRQYRSAIFFANDKQREIAAAYIKQLEQARSFQQPIATQLEPFNAFYAAGESHQNFVARNPNYPYVVLHDLPKVQQLKKQFPDLYRS
jgi:peptide-methionine (S)-S-oxide reductase